MEAFAPFTAMAPEAPRNLAAPLAAWLRAQGFAVTEKPEEEQATLLAIWEGPGGERFGLTYLWSPRYGGTTLSLQVAYPDRPEPETLLSAQQVRRLKEARLLLLGNLRYANARLVTMPPSPATT